jgi:hypothetical protein
MLDDTRLGQIIAACYAALRRPDLDCRIRRQIENILVRAQARAREVLR